MANLKEDHESEMEPLTTVSFIIYLIVTTILDILLNKQDNDLSYVDIVRDSRIS